MFEGANKNLIVFTQKNLKNQQFAFSNKTNNWFNVHTQRALMLENNDQGRLVAGINVITGKVNKKSADHSQWEIVPCNLKSPQVNEQEHEEKKKKKKEEAEKKKKEGNADKQNQTASENDDSKQDDTIASEDPTKDAEKDKKDKKVQEDKEKAEA